MLSFHIFGAVRNGVLSSHFLTEGGEGKYFELISSCNKKINEVTVIMLCHFSYSI